MKKYRELIMLLIGFLFLVLGIILGYVYEDLWKGILGIAGGCIMLAAHVMILLKNRRGK